MKIYLLDKETQIESPLKKSFIELNKHKRIKGYIFQAMKILGCGLRDIASICGYQGNNDFLLFVKYISVRHRMLIISPKFDFMRSKIENEIRKKLKDEEKDSMEKAG